ncbi:flagellar hook-associated protein 3 FlgL [Nocardioides ginsengisegetis]|uniref:Flagellar hook-associated protein 3 FlgL n=1 Tax=Nocardioides ginsengisegetis TaxID=661491 RepID=A0A7W3PAY6_9ACTN|nr:flagellar hook-associated protein FlgL [Nocardioides ginsengisegetis]MBA8805001.1 flagellar hook-associated protein 3 FlgL [Nocardioides ginsengisegetis]
MTVTRVTQTMLSHRALDGLQVGLGRVSRIQEQLSTGRIINRPSDDPTGATAAMRLRSSVADHQQYARNADDGVGWLDQVDTTLSSMTSQVRRAREVAINGANTGANGPDALRGMAAEVDQIRAGLISEANATYLGRPVFGGITSGAAAYDATGAYIGKPGEVVRTVADGVKIRVDQDGPAAFGIDGDSVFDHLTALSTALKAGDATGITQAIDVLGKDGTRITNAQTDVGTRTVRIEQARQKAGDAELSLTSALSEIENTDLPKATVDLQLQQVAYQAALAATAKVIQPSLLDFLR